MIELPFLIIYAVIAFVAACRMGTLAAWSMLDYNKREYAALYTNTQNPTVGQWFSGGVIGLLASVIWPLLIVGYMGRNVLFKPPEKARLEQSKNRIAELEAENEKLDRQLERITG